MSYSKTSWKTLCFARGLLGCPSVCPSIHPSVPQICMNDTTIPSELLRNSAYVWQIQHNCMQMKWKQFLFLVSGRKSAVFKTVVPQPKTLRQQQYRMKDTAYTLKSHHASCPHNGNQWHTPKNVNRYKKDYQCLKMCLDKLFHEKISLSILIS